jgi:hypothetical protein
MPARRGCPDFKEESRQDEDGQEEDQRHRGEEEDLCSGLDFRAGLSKILDMN